MCSSKRAKQNVMNGKATFTVSFRFPCDASRQKENWVLVPRDVLLL